MIRRQDIKNFGRVSIITAIVTDFADGLWYSGRVELGNGFKSNLH